MLKNGLALSLLLGAMATAGPTAAASRANVTYCGNQSITNVAMWVCVKKQPAAMRMHLAISSGRPVVTWVLWCVNHKPFTRTVQIGAPGYDIRVDNRHYPTVFRQMLASRTCRVAMLIQAPLLPSQAGSLNVTPYWNSR